MDDLEKSHMAAWDGPKPRWRVKREAMSYRGWVAPDQHWLIFAPNEMFADHWAATQPEAFAFALDLAEKAVRVP